MTCYQTMSGRAKCANSSYFSVDVCLCVIRPFARSLSSYTFCSIPKLIEHSSSANDWISLKNWKWFQLKQKESKNRNPVKKYQAILLISMVVQLTLVLSLSFPLSLPLNVCVFLLLIALTFFCFFESVTCQHEQMVRLICWPLCDQCHRHVLLYDGMSPKCVFKLETKLKNWPYLWGAYRLHIHIYCSVVSAPWWIKRN